MDALVVMLKNVIIFVLLAIPGFLLVKAKKLKKEQSGALSALLMYVGMPFLVFTSTVNKVTLNTKLLTTIAISIVIGLVFHFAMFFVSKPLTKGDKDQKVQGMTRFCSIFSNSGFLGFPLAMAVFGDNSMALTVLIIINIIMNVLMFTLGVYLVSGDKKTISLKKAFLNPVLIAFVLGIVANLLNLKEYLPEAVTYSTHFSNLVTPISMTILGMKMGDVKLMEFFKCVKLYYVSLLKLVVFPVVAVGLIFLLKLVWNLVTADVVLGTLLAFATPTAGLASTFADSYGGDSENAVVLTLGTTILSIISIPLLYWGVCLLLQI